MLGACLALWGGMALLLGACSSGSALHFQCRVVRGAPEFTAVPSFTTVGCSMHCSRTAACDMFAFSTSAEVPCQLAASNTSGSTPTPLFITPDADVDIIPDLKSSPSCEEVMAVTTDNPDTTESAGTTQTVSSSQYTRVADNPSWSGCKQACIDEGKRMTRCPATKEGLDDLAAEFGSSTKIFLYGFRATNLNDFVDEDGNVVISSDSTLWAADQPDDRLDRDAGLYAHWSKVADIQDEAYDAKGCVCID